MPGTSLKQKIGLFILGIFLCVLFLEIAMQISGFVILALRDRFNSVALHRKGAYRILCLGESTTFCGGTEFSYPYQIEEMLNKKGLGVNFSVINEGVPGINTSYILAHLEENINIYKPDMVIAMMGINDCGEYIFYQDRTTPRIIVLLRSLKTYKLSRLIWMHLTTKVKEIVALLEERKVVYAGEPESRVYPEILEAQEIKFKKAIEAKPLDYSAYMDLGWFYRSNAKYAEAEEVLKKAVELDRLKSSAYVALGWCYRDQGKYYQAEEILRQAIALDPDKDEAYILLGCCYEEDGKPQQAEETFKELIRLSPDKDATYMALGWFYRNQGDLPPAEDAFRKAAQLNPANAGAYIELGGCYRDHGKLPESEEAFKKAVEADPGYVGAYIELARYYRDQGKYDRAEEILRKAIESKLGNDEVYGALATCYIEQGKSDSAEDYFNQADKLRSGGFRLITSYNYQKMQDILNKKGIKMVCVQYPLRSIGPLKKIFESTEGILFVDNEKIFKDALKSGKYEDFFMDRFGGDFGHCTKKGNELLAKNIVEVLVQECFKKSL